MEALIDDLLRLARITRAEIPIPPSISVRWPSKSADGLRESAPARLAEFPSVEDGLIASGDARLCAIVLENLLSNAWKFTATQPVARIEFGSEIDGWSNGTLCAR